MAEGSGEKQSISLAHIRGISDAVLYYRLSPTGRLFPVVALNVTDVAGALFISGPLPDPLPPETLLPTVAFRLSDSIGGTCMLNQVPRGAVIIGHIGIYVDCNLGFGGTRFRCRLSEVPEEAVILGQS